MKRARRPRVQDKPPLDGDLAATPRPAPAVQVPGITQLRTDLLMPVEGNPNEQDAATFGALVSSIQEIGFVEPILVRRRPEGGYDIVSGEHRWRAARVLNMETIPCISVDGLSDEDVKVLLVRMNALRGNLNPWKFTRLFNELRRSLPPDELRTRMGLTSEREFRRVYQDVRKSLPPELRHRLDQAKEEVQDVEGLARVVQAHHGRVRFGPALQPRGVPVRRPRAPHGPGHGPHLGEPAAHRGALSREKQLDVNGYLNALLERDTDVEVQAEEAAG